MDYKVVTGETASDLTHIVKDYIKMGWIPLGGVSVYVTGFNHNGDTHFSQAIIFKG